MTHAYRRRALAALAALGCIVRAPALTAQTAGADPDAAFRRAQSMVGKGDSAGARALVDSLVRAAREGSDARANALFWRATFAPDPRAARADYLIITVDYAFSPRAADALLRLAIAEYASGDRPAALRHLDRLILEHPASNAAADGWYRLGRARIDDGDVAAGCIALDSARARLTPADVERSTQVAYYKQRCRALVAAPAAAPVAAPPPADTVASTPRWSVQVAAYKTKAEAERLVKTLKARGYEARVDELTLFHVRIGAYEKRADATALVVELKAQRINAIVVEATRRGP